MKKKTHLQTNTPPSPPTHPPTHLPMKGQGPKFLGSASHVAQSPRSCRVVNCVGKPSMRLSTRQQDGETFTRAKQCFGVASWVRSSVAWLLLLFAIGCVQHFWVCSTFWDGAPLDRPSAGGGFEQVWFPHDILFFLWALLSFAFVTFQSVKPAVGENAWSAGEGSEVRSTLGLSAFVF